MNIVAISLTFYFYAAKANISGWLKVLVLGKGRKWEVCGLWFPLWFPPVLPHLTSFNHHSRNTYTSIYNMPHTTLGTEAPKDSSGPQKPEL